MTDEVTLPDRIRNVVSRIRLISTATDRPSPERDWTDMLWACRELRDVADELERQRRPPVRDVFWWQARAEQLDAELSKILSDRASWRARALCGERLRAAQSAAARFMEAATYGDGFPGGIEARADVLRRALDDARPQPPDRI